MASTPPAFYPATPDSESESQALRDWDRLLAQPDSDVTRHALVHGSGSGSPHLAPCSPATAPKLAAERDKEGHIEYKLKLIEPSPVRFERLVTQMMWRLKQGRNEAIYELGLADDGTVIGLTRAEMDASLRTLERMASEVGATVMVLKEIVLAPALPDSPSLSPSMSSAASVNSWWARRPDLDKNGRPRKGTRGVNGEGPETKSRRQRTREEAAPLKGANGHTRTSSAESFRLHEDDSETDPTPFHLDMDDSAPATNRSTPSPTSDSAAAAAAISAAREENKRRKSAARREQRRLDLLRGDGTSPMPYAADRSSSPVAEFIGHAPRASTALAAAAAASRLPHQPTRPSTLRLARTHSGPISSPTTVSSPVVPLPDLATLSIDPTSPDTPIGPDDAFLDGLSLPLDSLSLSFADVRGGRETEPVDESGTSTVAASPEDHIATGAPPAYAPPPGESMICVEALVVRKRQHGDEWGLGGEEDGWGFGGEDDGWGFGDGGDE